MDLLLIISVVWTASEIILARWKHSSPSSSQHDRLSLRVLWTAIALSISAGVWISIGGYGFIAPGHHLITWSGLLLILAGLVVRWAAILTLRKYFTVDVSIRSDHKIVRTGLYRYLRHPAYSGSLLSFFGLAISYSNWVSAIVIFVPITIAFLYRIKVEEEALMSFFGAEYVNYCAATYRLIPGIY